MAGWLTPVLAGAAKYGPRVGANITKYFPRYLAGGLGAKGLMEEGLWGGLKGAVGGYGVGQFGNRALIGGIGNKVLPRLAGTTQIAGQMMPAAVGQGLSGLAQAAIPLGVLGANQVLTSGVGGPIADTAGKVAQNTVNTAQNAGGGFLVQNLATGEQFLTGPQNALPGGMGPYGYVNPIGTQADQVDPTSPFSGRRLGTRLDARTNAAALNILMPTVRKYAEQRAKDELTRQLAAAGVRKNIDTNALLTEISARKDAEMGRRAMEQAGTAVTQNYATYQ